MFSMCKTDHEVIYNIQADAPLIIYKTRSDYFDKVPIIMNERKDIIVSYPSPKDIFINGVLAFPVKLKHGYLVDNRGVNKNTVFTSFTYEEYSKLGTAPGLDVLMKSIIDKDPFIEIYDCGTRSDCKNIKELNKLINSKFDHCKKLN